MKFYFVLLVCCLAYSAGAQTQIFHSFAPQERSLKEIHIQIPPPGTNNGLYYHTPIYNDMFTISDYGDHYLLPSSLDYYKAKKVAQVKITDNAGASQFILNISKDGRVAKSALFTAVMHEDEFFYDEAGKNIMTVKSYRLNNALVRIDTIRYSHQKKIINDTIYSYTAMQTRIYKSGSFLNEQNKYYNDTYGGIRMENSSLFYVPTVYYVKGKGKRKGSVKTEPNGTIYVKEKYPVNYVADRFYFSREQTDVEGDTYTFQQQPVNPGEAAIYLYVPELLHRNEVKYGDLACERFDEPRFMRRTYTCGTGAYMAREFSQMQMTRYYTFSQNNNGLQDTCFSTWGGGKSPQYYFSYTYFE